MIEGKYSASLKTKLLPRLVGPNAMSAMALSSEVGISASTLSRWLREAGTVSTTVAGKEKETLERSHRRARTSEEKLQVVIEGMKVPEAELGALLRREGLHEVQLREWREAVLHAGREALENNERSNGKMRKKETKRVRELEKELRRKEKALAEAAALLILEKKLQVLWGAEGGDTDEESET